MGVHSAGIFSILSGGLLQPPAFPWGRHGPDQLAARNVPIAASVVKVVDSRRRRRSREVHSQNRPMNSLKPAFGCESRLCADPHPS